MCLISEAEPRDFMLRPKHTTALDPADEVYYEGYEQARSDAAAKDEARKRVIEEWLPIETAPKDGTHILAYRLRNQGHEPDQSANRCSLVR
jgi:hypothetical protein